MITHVDDVDVAQSRIYQLDPARFPGFRRRMVARMAVVTPLLLAGIWYLDGRVESRRDLFDFVGLPAIIAWVGYRSIQREREKLDTLILEFRSGHLVRELPDFPRVEIAPNEVTKIVESTQGIMIKTNSRLKFLFVNRGLLNYDDFRSRLAIWAPSTEVAQATPSVLTFIKSVASVSLCIALFGGPLYLMDTPYHKLILPLGIGLTAAFAAMIGHVQHSAYFPISLRRKAWILLALPLLAMFSRLFLSD